MHPAAPPPSPRRQGPPGARRLRTLLVAALGLLSGRALRAGDVPWLYATQDRGDVRVQGTLLETLTGKFDPQDLLHPAGTDRWVDFAVVDDQRYSLRLDGLVERNGTLVLQLPFAVANYVWQRLLVEGGALHALRSDGLFAVDGAQPVALDHDGFIFYDLAAAGGHVYALRSDGGVFRDDQPDATVTNFNGGKGTLKVTEGKGSFGASHWIRLRFDPDSGLLIALRGDGKMQTLDPATNTTAVLDSLPFPKKDHNVRVADLYIDMETAAGVPWTVLRNDGRLYDATSTDTPLVDLPGKPRQSARHENYVDLTLDSSGSPWALRADGLILSGATGATVVRLPGLRWIKLAATQVEPVLEGADSYAPQAAVLDLRLVEGQPLSLPLVANDVDVASEALQLSADVSELPGASFDAGTRTLHWPSPGPTGKSQFVLTIDDGSGEPTSVKYRVRVKPAHAGGGNTRPEPSPYDVVQALVGEPLVLPLLAVDRDGDELSFEPVLGEGAFALGATFDAETRSLVWTPGLSDLGRTTSRVRVTDGQRTSTLKLRIEVLSPLHFAAR